MKAMNKLPIPARRVFRLAFGGGMATLIAYSFFPDYAYIFVLLALLIMMPPAPPPASKLLIKLLVILCIALFWGLCLGQIFIIIPSIGLILFMIGIAATIKLGISKPEMAIVSMLFVVGQTIVTVVSYQSSAVALTMIGMMMGGFIFAFALAWFSHLFFLRENTDMKPPDPDANDSHWVPVRAAIIMLPPFLMALQNLFFIPLLIKGSILAQQNDKRNVMIQARDLMLGTIFGAIMAMTLWNILQIWPSLIFFTLCLTVAIYIMACYLYNIWATRHGFLFWQNALVTLVILIGPAVQDPTFSDNIDQKMWIRVFLFLAVSLYNIAAVQLLDTLHDAWVRKRKAITP